MNDLELRTELVIIQTELDVASVPGQLPLMSQCTQQLLVDSGKALVEIVLSEMNKKGKVDWFGKLEIGFKVIKALFVIIANYKKCNQS